MHLGDPVSQLAATYRNEVVSRLERLTDGNNANALDDAAALIVESLNAGGIIHAFGTGHSEAFAMEVAGRAGGLIPTNRIALRDVVLHGDRDASILAGATLERDPSVVAELLDGLSLHDADLFVIASNSGVNGSVVEMAVQAKQRGHKVIAVTSLEHTNAVTPKHPSGRRLSELADVVIDNLAPYGDATMTHRRRHRRRRGVLDHRRDDRPTAHDRRGRPTRAGRRDPTRLHLGEHPRR